MEHIRTFFDTSTIHGLSWISSTRKWSRLFWIMIVIGGFSGAGYLIHESFHNWHQSPGAGYLIHESFHNWHQSPISTTVETLPISKMKFPNVTVCPPKNLFLNLNYDILQSEKVKLDKNKREKIIKDSLVVYQEQFYNEMMRNLSKVEDPDRYYNWYHGYTAIRYPCYSKRTNQLSFCVSTSATTGNISTQYYEDKFDIDKVDGNIYIQMYVYVPRSVVGDNNVTLMLDVNKKTMKEVSDNDQMRFNWNTDIDANWSKNITAPRPSYGYYFISLDREVSQDDITNMKLEMMPGFRFSWSYNTKIEPEDIYGNDDTTKEFVRYE